MRALPTAALPLIRQFESFSPTPYLCPAGKWTYGWGSTVTMDGKPVTKDTPAIGLKMADQLLFRDAIRAMQIVLSAVTVPLNDNQLSGLVSFTYNVGPGKKGVKDGFVELKQGGPSTLLRALNAGYYDIAANQMAHWVYAAGRKLHGLELRRSAEIALFQTPA